MTIWGDADVDDIPDNPFHIAENTYTAIITESYELNKDGNRTLIFKWTIQEPESEFNNMPVTEKYTLPVEGEPITGEIKQRLSFLKKRMREAFDLTPEEIKGFVPKMAMGKRAYIDIINSPDKKDPKIIYNNVRNAISPRLFMENQANGQSYTSDLDV